MKLPEHDSLYDRGRALEEAFFAERDRQLMDKLKRKLSAEETERVLAAAVGIADEATLNALTKVEAGVPVLAAMALVPMVEVAWCDGDVSSKERDAIMNAAEDMEIAADSVPYDLLKGWLENRPGLGTIVAWKDYVRAICATLDPTAVFKLKQGVMGRAEKVAQAAGGILGMGNKVSAAERKCLDELTKAFES
ncbi:MAG TPA: hypothetical protein VMP01_25345 [Pirellulaceae bacterium]|nr:hypothetical protein [Pirellulaceae bacterium]